jgi:tRNA-2-methylthio-N6-dimethylallyladenosine synthase
VGVYLPSLSQSASHFTPLPLAQRDGADERVPVREPIVPRLGRPPRVHLWHIGCQMNDADHERLAESFAEIGFVPDVPLGDADIAVLISCAVRSNAEQKVYGKFKVEHGSALLERMADLDYMFDVREPEGFFARLQSLYGGDVDGPVTMPASDRLLAYVPVMGGCNEMCTYCIVPFVRGRESSRPTGAIVDDVRRLVDRGVREVTLLGQNVNSYRDPDTGAGLPELLAAVDAVTGLRRLRFLTSHPRNAVPELFRAMRDLPSVCEQLHLPVQAGDDALLRRMRRVYSVAEYREKIAAAVATVPHLALTTDIIVGFCGETEAEFEGTVQLLRDVRYDVVHIQAYSVRPGTAAARRDDNVPLAEKKRRLNHLLDIQRGIALERNRALRGRRVEVLVEGVAAGARPYGRTRQGKVAWLPSGSAVAGELRSGRVQEATHWQLELDAVSPAA